MPDVLRGVGDRPLCQFCHQHGEGKRWYLNAENYAEDLMSDLRRQEMVRHFFDGGMERDLQKARDDFERLHQAPRIVQSMVRGTVERRMKKEHFGQVVPLEEVERILDDRARALHLPQGLQRQGGPVLLRRHAQSGATPVRRRD